MMIVRRALVTLACSVIAHHGASAVAAQVNENYAATSGRTPSAPWVLDDSTPSIDPTVRDGSLVLSTNLAGELMAYVQRGPDLQLPFPTPLVIEFSVRFVSGSSNHAARAPTMLVCAPMPFVGNVLFVGDGEVFLLSADLQRGASIAIPTADAAHVYRVEIDAAAPGSAVRVFRDNAVLPILVGATFQMQNHPPIPTIAFGDWSALANGTSEWQFVRHNAGATCIRAATEWSPMCPAGYHSQGGPVLEFVGRPTLGATFSVRGGNLFAGTPAVLLLGTERSAIDLGRIGSLPGSRLCIAPIVSLGYSGQASASQSLTVPNAPELCRIALDLQWLNADAASTLPLPIGSSAAGRFTIGL